MNKVYAAVLSIALSSGLLISSSTGLFCTAVSADEEYQNYEFQGYSFQMPVDWNLSEEENEATFSINTEESHAMIRFKTSPYPGDSFQEQYTGFNAAIDGIGEGDDSFVREEIEKYPVGDYVYLIGEFTKADRNYLIAFLADEASETGITIMLGDNTLGESFSDEFYRVLDSTEAGEDKIPSQEVWDNAESPSGSNTTEVASTDEQREEITVPAQYAEDITQEKLDEEAGENYQSAVINKDGSVTYKMTKKQHQIMMYNIRNSIDEDLQELIDDNEHYNISAIDYNTPMTEFNILLDGDKASSDDSSAALEIYAYGKLYNVYMGQNVDNIAVNYYAADGTFLETANSSELDA